MVLCQSLKLSLLCEDNSHVCGIFRVNIGGLENVWMEMWTAKVVEEKNHCAVRKPDSAGSR